MAASPHSMQDLLHAEKITDISSFVIPKNYHKKYHHSTKFLSKNGVKKLAFLKFQLEKIIAHHGLHINEYDRDLYELLIGMIDNIVIDNTFSVDDIYDKSPSGPIGLIRSSISLALVRYFSDIFNTFNVNDFSRAISLGSSFVSLFSKGYDIENHMKQATTTLKIYTDLLSLIEKISHEANLFYEARSFLKEFVSKPESEAVFLNFLDRAKTLPLISIYQPFEKILASQHIIKGTLATSRQLCRVLKILQAIARKGSDTLKLKLHEAAIVIRERLHSPENASFLTRKQVLYDDLAVRFEDYCHDSPNPAKKAILSTMQQKFQAIDGDGRISEQVNSLLAIVTEAYQANLDTANKQGFIMSPGRTGDIIAAVYNHILTIMTTACLSDDKETEDLVNQLCEPPVLRSRIIQTFR